MGATLQHAQGSAPAAQRVRATPQPAARKSTQPTPTSGLDTKGRDTMVSGECPPTTPAMFSRLPGAG